jgi:hypothetical protein
MSSTAALGLAMAVGLVFTAPAAAQTYDCRRYPPADVMASLKTQAETMRKIEIETAGKPSASTPAGRVNAGRHVFDRAAGAHRPLGYAG